MTIFLTSCSDDSSFVKMYFFLFSDLCRGGATLLASWSSSLDSTPPPTSPPLPLSLIHFRGEPMGVPPSDFALTTWREKREETETDRMTIYLEYHIAENFQGRKLLRISWFCGCTQNFSLRNLGRDVLWRCKSKQSAKVFSAKIVFSPIRESLLPRRFPAIRYVITSPPTSSLLCTQTNNTHTSPSTLSSMLLLRLQKYQKDCRVCT